MPDPVTLKRIQDTATALNDCRVATLEDLRMCISRDVDRGIQIMSRRTGTSQALLMALLIAEASDKTAVKGNRKLLDYWRSLKTFPAVWSLSRIEIGKLWDDKVPDRLRKSRKPVWDLFRQSVVRPRRLLSNWRRHWLDVLALVVLPLIVVSLLFQVRSLNKPAVSYVAVKQGTGLQVFHRITGEIELKSATGANGAFTSIDQVQDRYTLAAVPAGSLIESNQLLSAELSQKMQNRKILTVPIRIDAYNSALLPPIEAIMVLSARHPDLKAEPMTFEVIVLRLESNGEARSVTVALTEEQFKIAAPRLASHDVFLSPSVP